MIARMVIVALLGASFAMSMNATCARTLSGALAIKNGAPGNVEPAGWSTAPRGGINWGWSGAGWGYRGPGGGRGWMHGGWGWRGVGVYAAPTYVSGSNCWRWGGHGSGSADRLWKGSALRASLILIG
jgi:hypothetical protein